MSRVIGADTLKKYCTFPLNMSIFQVTKKVENPVVDLPPKKHSVVVEQNAAGGQPITRIENTIEASEAANEEPKFVSQGCQTERTMMATASNHLGTNATETSNANNKEGESLSAPYLQSPAGIVESPPVHSFLFKRSKMTKNL